MRQFYFTLIFILFSGLCFSQITKIDYKNKLDSSLCSVFNLQGGKVINGVIHEPGAGGTRGNSQSVILRTTQSSSFQYFGTAYAIDFSFKKDTTYIITINAQVKSQNSVASPYLVVDLLQALPDPNITHPTSCDLVSSSSFYPFDMGGQTAYGNYIIKQVQNYTFTITPPSDFSYMSFLSKGGSQNTYDSILINSITINEKPFPIYELDNSKINYYCNSTSPVTIKLTKKSGEINSSLHFKWKFPQNSHWNYGGLPVPPEITTDSSFIILSPDGMALPSAISIDEVFNGNVVSSFATQVVSSNPIYSIRGPQDICDTAVYYIDSLINGSVVTWSAEPSSFVETIIKGDSLVVFSDRYITSDINLSAIIQNTCSSKMDTILRTVKLRRSLGAVATVDGTQFNYCFELKPTQYPGIFSSTMVIAPEVTHASLTYSYPTDNHEITISNSGKIYTLTGHPTSVNALKLVATNGCVTRTINLIVRGPGAPPCLPFPPDLDNYNVSPNPAVNKVFINRRNTATKINKEDKTKSDIETVIIFNILGQIQKISYDKIEKMSTIVDISGLKKGPYFILITDKSGKQERHKIIVN